MIKNRPLTGYLLIFGLAFISIANIILCILFFNTETNFLIDVLHCFFIGWTILPYFILSILKNEISATTIIMYVLISCVSLVYLTVSIIALRKPSKGVNGLLILILSIDILLVLPMLFDTVIIGIINISMKAFLIFLCTHNIRWYNENYELLKK